MRILKKTCAIELNEVLFCFRLYLIEIVLYTFTMSVKVARTKINVEKYILHSVKIYHGYPNSALKASENHVGVKRGVRILSLSCKPIRNVLYGFS